MWLLNLIFPKKCIFCRNFGKNICQDCLDKTIFNYDCFCIICQKRTLNGNTCLKCKGYLKPNKFIAPFVYYKKVRSIILKSKYFKKEFKLTKDLIDYLYIFSEQFDLNFNKNTLITYIPADPKRFKKRGFNLAKIIAEEIGLKNNIEIKGLLQKTLSTPPLTKLSKKQRKINIKNKFTFVYINKENCIGKDVIIVDDICTTGSTLVEATKVLKRNGFKKVTCLALAFNKKNIFLN